MNQGLMKTDFGGRKTSLCYLEKDGRYLILHRTKKEHDENQDKWIGVGGKFEPGETPDVCALREVKEETGLSDLICIFAMSYQSSYKQDIMFSPKAKISVWDFIF